MKKSILIFCLLILLGEGRIQAQCGKIDSLQRSLLVIKQNDTLRVSTLNHLVEEFILNQQYEKAMFYTQKSIDLAQKINYPMGLGNAYLLLGRVYRQDILRYEESLASFKQALQIFKEHQLKAEQAKALRTIGEYYYSLYYMNSQAYYEKSLNYYKAYYKLIENEKDYKKLLDASTMIGKLYSQLGNEEQSQAYFQKAFEYKTQLEDEDISDPHLFSNVQKFYELRLEHQRLYTYSLIFGLALAAGFIVLFVILFIQKQRSHRRVLAQKEQIAQQNDELQQQQEEIMAQRDQIAEQYQKLQETQEELEASNDKLTDANDQLEAANDKLENLNEHLEEQVAERTRDLNISNENLKVVNEELDLLIYRASHDFKGPVATLTGLTQIGRMECTEESPAQIFFAKIEETANKMDAMLEKLHQVSFIIGKKVHYDNFSVAKALNRSQEMLAKQLKEQPIEIIQRNTDTEIRSDIEILEVIFENIIENAIYFQDANKDEAPVLEISVESDEKGLSIEFRDNGEGIEGDMQHKIFNMFFRGSEASRGNGLGLYVVKKCLDRLNANAKVLSFPKQYSIFKLYFPKPTAKDEENTEGALSH